LSVQNSPKNLLSIAKNENFVLKINKILFFVENLFETPTLTHSHTHTHTHTHKHTHTLIYNDGSNVISILNRNQVSGICSHNFKTIIQRNNNPFKFDLFKLSSEHTTAKEELQIKNKTD